MNVSKRRMCQMSTRLTAVQLVLAGAAHCSAQCTLSWSGPHADSSSGTIYSMVPFRGPSGAVDLYCAGSFRNAGAPGIHTFARWRATPIGSGFEMIPDGPSGTTWPQVYSMIVHDLDGPGGAEPVVIMGGLFPTAGGMPVNNIAVWNGVTWSGLGSGFNDQVTALLAVAPGQGSIPPGLYAGGGFTAAGGVPVSGLARWDGSQWQAVPGGVSYPTQPGAILGMALYDPDESGAVPPALYVTGAFYLAGGVSASAIAGWDGTNWFALGSGLGGYDGHGYTLFTADLDGPGPEHRSLIVGGSFTLAGPITTRDVARWDGAAWSALGGGLGWEHSQVAYQFVMFDADAEGPLPSQLTAVGTFQYQYQTQGAPGYMARWDGDSWVHVAAGGSAPPFLVAHSGAVFDEDGAGPLPASLYVGGFGGLARHGCRLCAANCDQSVIAPVLNVNDFSCFINAFAAGDPYANCDGSTIEPVLNVNDFTCFLNRYAAGCP